MTALALAGCEDEDRFTKAEKDIYYQNCQKFGGEPSIYQFGSKGNTLQCEWYLPTKATDEGFSDGTSMLFGQFGNYVRDDGLWIDILSSELIFSEACKKLGGEIATASGTASGCLKEGAIYHLINLAVAFR